MMLETSYLMMLELCGYIEAPNRYVVEKDSTTAFAFLFLPSQWTCLRID